MPYIYRVLRDRAHVERHINYLKNGSPSYYKILKSFTIAGTEKKNKKVAGHWEEQQTTEELQHSKFLADFLMVNFIGRFFERN
jgi:hypothetical protein